nr:hypothetical protein GCM10017606_29690 [Microbacterium terregens]
MTAQRFYRTYARDWTPTGWATEPQYPGQMHSTHDRPAACIDCGGKLIRWVLPQHVLKADPDVRFYDWICAKDHLTAEVPIATLLGSPHQGISQ